MISTIESVTEAQMYLFRKNHPYSIEVSIQQYITWQKKVTKSWRIFVWKLKKGGTE